MIRWRNKETDEWEDVNLRFFGRRMRAAFDRLLGFRLRRIKLISYKRRKVKATRIEGEKMYTIYFNIVIKDSSNPQTVGPMKIDVPAKAVFFAKRKLVKHLQNNVDIDVLDFDINVNDNQDEEPENDRG